MNGGYRLVSPDRPAHVDSEGPKKVFLTGEGPAPGSVVFIAYEGAVYRGRVRSVRIETGADRSCGTVSVEVRVLDADGNTRFIVKPAALVHQTANAAAVEAFMDQEPAL